MIRDWFETAIQYIVVGVFLASYWLLIPALIVGAFVAGAWIAGST